MDFRKATVVGAGIMGHGIAEVIALSGIRVSIEDAYPSALEKAKESISSSLDRLVKSGKLTPEKKNETLSMISFHSDLKESLKESDIVIEAVPEIPELKQQLIADISKIVGKDTIIGSNTSNILIGEISKNATHPENVVGIHFFNPPVVLKLVEVIRSEKTSAKVFDAAYEFVKKLGKVPIRVMKDTPGFVVNRINAPESLLFGLIVQRNMARPSEVDAFVKAQGLPMGPYELMDYVGIDTMAHSLDYYSKALHPDYGKCTIFSEMVKKNLLGMKTGQGFYKWEGGHAKIDAAQPSNVIDLLDVLSLEINEAVKLIENGVASPDDIETGVKLGMNRPFGPISVSQGLTNAEIKAKLKKLSEKFGVEVFYPAGPIDEGRLREALSGIRNVARENSPTKAESTQEGSGSVKVSVNREKRIARIVISNTRNNLLNVDVIRGLENAMRSLWDNKEVNVIVVSGEGSTFSAGAQLTQFFSGPMDFSQNSRFGERTFRLFSEIPKLTIAQISGYALGGGFELSSWCDLRISTPDAQFGLPEVTLGLVPGWGGSQRLAKLIGISRAMQIILSGERFSGEYMEKIGFVWKTFPAETITAEVDRIAEDLAARLAPVSVGIAKSLINKGSDVPADVGLEMESIAMGLLYGTDDLKEGISAFLQKRKPEYKGH